MAEAKDRPPSPTLIQQIDRLGRRQRSLITSKQLDAFGLGRSGRHWAVATGRMRRIRRGVYVLAGAQPDWATTVLAAVLAAGPGAVASHLTAGRLWDLFDRPSPEEQAPCIHVIGLEQRRLEGARVHRHVLANHERSTRLSVPVTSVARTLFDLSSMMDGPSLGRCTDEAIRRGLLDLRALRSEFESHRGPGRHRLLPLHQVLSERVPGFDPGANDWERRMDRLWDELGLPAAYRQYPIATRGGHYRVDRAVLELRLVVEWVGCEFHGQRGRFNRDRIRISDLVQAGWDVLEVTPDWTTERLRRTVLAKVAERQRLLTDRAG